MSVKRSATGPLLIIMLAALVAGVASWTDKLASLDNTYFDFLSRWQLLDYPDDIAIVAVDEASIARLGAWPWSRAIHARLLSKLKTADAVIFDVIFSERQSPSVVSAITDDDDVFAAAIAQAGNVVLPLFIEEQQFRGLKNEVLPHPMFAKRAASLGHVQVDSDIDGITRGVYLLQGLGSAYWPHLAKALSVFLAESSPQGKDDSLDAVDPYRIEKADFTRIRYVGSAGSIYRFSYIDVLEGRVASRQFAGKRVFIGATAKGLGDDIPTPLGLMSGVEFHANVYESIRQHQLIATVDRGIATLISVMLVVVGCYFLSHFSPLKFFVGTFLVGLTLLLLSAFLLKYFALWFSPSATLLAIALFYPVWSWRRIELALVFLRNELSQVKSEANKSESLDYKGIERQLNSLVTLDLVESAQITSTHDCHLWPEIEQLNDVLTTGIVLADARYSISLTAPKIDARIIFTSLLGDASNGGDGYQSSYELVEQTINEIHFARRSANQLQRRMNRSMEKLQDAVIVTDRTGKIIFANGRSKTVFKDELIGLSIVDLGEYLDKYQWLSLVKAVMNGGKSVYDEVERGDEQCLLCQAMLLGDSSREEQTAVYVFTDVTLLRNLERSKNEALAFLSHDMRSPIVSQLSLIERFNMETTRRIEEFQSLVEQLAVFSNMSLKYAESFLQLSRAEHLDHRDFGLVDMHSVVDSAYAQVAVLGVERKIRIVIERTDDECWLLGDSNLLERAIMNLLANAIQYSDEAGEILLSITMQKQICVSIADTGQGIDEAALPHLFEPYFREVKEQIGIGEAENQPVKRKAKLRNRSNYGLGLSFVNTVVKKHGGHIEVESKKNEGTTFRLLFTAAEID